jgi:hypothetical protein
MGATVVGMSDPGGTLLTTVGSSAEAEILCGELRANGIKCGYALSDVAGGMAMVTEGSPNVGPVDVFVEDDKLDEARQLLPG